MLINNQSINVIKLSIVDLILILLISLIIATWKYKPLILICHSRLILEENVFKPTPLVGHMQRYICIHHMVICAGSINISNFTI